MKKFLSILLSLAIIFTIPVPVSAKVSVSAKKVKTAYTSYLKKAIENEKFADNITYNLYDFNKDGVKELIVSEPGGARAIESVYTYKNNKVVMLSEGWFNGIGYIKGKKYVVGYGSGGAQNFNYTVYKITKGKLKKVTKYACVNGDFQKDSKTISKNNFMNFVKTVKFSPGKTYKISKKYYSPKKLGISVNASKTNTCIEKADKNKVYYRNITLGDEGIIASKSKLKSAKITSNTKFYYGDTTHLFGDNPAGKDMDSKKWIYELSKSQFLKTMKTYKGTCDQIVIKNGKVVKVFIHIQVAG